MPISPYFITNFPFRQLFPLREREKINSQKTGQAEKTGIVRGYEGSSGDSGAGSGRGSGSGSGSGLGGVQSSSVTVPLASSSR